LSFGWSLEEGFSTSSIKRPFVSLRVTEWGQGNRKRSCHPALFSLLGKHLFQDLSTGKKKQTYLFRSSGKNFISFLWLGDPVRER
jgi:hypothetical protein